MSGRKARAPDPAPEGYATREEAAAYLRRKKQTLANWVPRTYGPPFTTVGGIALYPWHLLKAWAAEQGR